GPSPPHVVVARDGGFVTCLGGEMSTGTLPTLPWERVSLWMNRADRIQEELDRADAVLETGELGKLLERVYRAGPALAREDFEQLMAVEPLMYGDFAKAIPEVYRSMQRFGYRVARFKRFGDRELRIARALWELHHALGHLLLLIAPSVRRLHDKHLRAEEPPERHAGLLIALPMVHVGDSWLALRALHLVAVLGRDALPYLKREMAEAKERYDWLGAVLGTVAVGLRHRKARAEALGMLSIARAPERFRDETSALWLASVKDFFAAVPTIDAEAEGLTMEEAADRRVAAAFAHMRQAAVARGAPPPEGEPPPPPSASAAAQWQLNVWEGTSWVMLGLGLAGCAPADPTVYFYPREHAQALAAGFSVPAAQRLAEPFAPEPPVRRAEPKVGRNEPCPCGSGQKYKRCHGRHA
ncbi:MAG TPA: SEC-C metal-binding domain-containing protein, partial [Acidimicrobiales bacterium]|nr:SEC-C metal-binding domain-containing protein [Acidimicrobiales bacterium]